MRRLQTLALGAAVLTSTGAAHAHAGGGGTGLLDGLLHPLSGADHWVAMLAVGIWAAQIGGRALWAVPSSFLLAMAVSAMYVSGSTPAVVELGIGASLLVFGLVIATARRLPLAASGALVATFAVFHGLAHGAEMPAAASGLAYGTGFLLTTATLHAAGAGLGIALQRAHGELVRLSGAMIALGGGLALAG